MTPAPEALPLPEETVRTICIQCGDYFQTERGEEVCRGCLFLVGQDGIR